MSSWQYYSFFSTSTPSLFGDSLALGQLGVPSADFSEDSGKILPVLLIAQLRCHWLPMILPSSSTFFEHSNSSKLLIDPEISFLFFDKLILYQSRWRLKSGDCMILGLSLLSPRLRCPLLFLSRRDDASSSSSFSFPDLS